MLDNIRTSIPLLLARAALLVTASVAGVGCDPSDGQDLTDESEVADDENETPSASGQAAMEGF